MSRLNENAGSALAIAVLVIGVCAPPASAAVLRVPADYATIQAAIDAAETGDEVVLADGTYSGAGNINVDFLGKAITVRSAGGDPAACTIDCEALGRAFYIHNNTAPVRVEAIKIFNGHLASGNGGGILCSYGALDVRNCMFTANTDDGSGGAICAQSSTLTMAGCQFESCHANLQYSWDAAGGGALWVLGGSAVVENCIFHACTANVGCDYGGGAVGANTADVALRDCLITDCGAHGAGGGFFGRYCDVELRGNRFSQCHGFHTGGAVDLRYGTAVLANNVLSDCTATEGGGGVHLFDGHASLAGCTIVNNDGGSAYYGPGGGIYAYYMTSGLTITSTLVWGNTAHSDPQIYLYNTTCTVSYSDVQGGWSGVGNINQNPYFADAEYHLTSTSPCKNTGDPTLASAPAETDIDGQARKWPYTGRVDIGADEYGSYRFGDLNCDNLINAFDIDAFVTALTSPTAYAAAWPSCWYVLADCNADGAVNAFDIDPFVLVLTGG